MNKLLAAGKLDRRVVILRSGAPTRDAVNQAVPGVAIRTETWGSVRPAPGTERFANAENAATAPMRFVFRWRPDLVRVTDRIEHDSITYEVLSVNEIGRREGIEVLGSARAEGGA